MNRYPGILRLFRFHIVISFISQLLCVTVPIPGPVKLYLICGIVLLTVYLAAVYYTAIKSEKHELLFMEIWKLLIIAACIADLVTLNSLPLLSVVFLTPFRPLLLYNLKTGAYIIIACVLAESLIELAVLFSHRRIKNDSDRITR